jgi:hypothetical protein
MICKVINEKSIQNISSEVGISVEGVHSILHKDLNMNYLCEPLITKTVY